MVEVRREQRSLETLRQAIMDGSPAVALQRRPKQRWQPDTQTALVSVLDIRQVPLTRPQSSLVSVLVSEGEGQQLALGLVGSLLGIRGCGPSAHGFGEQIIELTESDVYGRGQRKWLACPGKEGAPCGSRRTKLYLPPGATSFACTDCHGLVVPHAPNRPIRYQEQPLRQVTLRWREPVEMAIARSA